MKTTKRLFAVLLAFVLVCATLQLALAEDGDATIYGTDGSLVWTIDNKGVLTINGEGAMSDRDGWSDSSNYYETYAWGPYRGVITKVIIKNGVTSIGSYAFSGCTSLANVTISDTVTIIGRQAFSGCTALPNVTIPNSVVSIGENAFSDCSALMGVILSDEIKTIEKGTFSECRSLLDITIPNKVTSINGAAFSNCQALKRVTISDSVEIIEGGAFWQCMNLEMLSIGRGLKYIGGSAFQYCYSISCVDISSLESWLNISFVNTYSNPLWDHGGNILLNGIPLETVSVPESIIKINAYAFYNCETIKTVTLPITVGSIGPDSFRGCSNLESITLFNGLCSIPDSPTAISPTAAICSYDNTEAQAYAEKYDRTFVSLGEYTHEHTPVVREVAGTCKTKGFRLTTCAVCGEQLDYEATTYGQHVFEVYDRWGNCVKGGTVEYRCSICGEYKTEQLPVTGHTFGDWQVQAAEGCTGSYEYRECTVCGWRETRNEQPGTHHWVEINRDNNCEKGGVGYYCDICGEKKWEQLPSKPHTFGEWQRQEPNGCEDGYELRVCTVCGYQESRVLQGNHDLVEYDRIVTKNSCKVYYTCSLCGKSYTAYICEGGHTFGAWSRFAMLTDAANEVEIRFCTVCGYYELRPAEQAEPTDPTEPTNPTDPTGPTNPTDPTDPTNPTDPTEPTNPTNPTNPTEPSEPVTEPTTSEQHDDAPQNFFQKIGAFFRNLFDRIFGIFRR